MTFCIHCDGMLKKGIKVIGNTKDQKRRFIHKHCYQEMLNTIWELGVKTLSLSKDEERKYRCISIIRQHEKVAFGLSATPDTETCSRGSEPDTLKKAQPEAAETLKNSTGTDSAHCESTHEAGRRTGVGASPQTLIEEIKQHINDTLINSNEPRIAQSAGVYLDYIVRSTIEFLQQRDIPIAEAIMKDTNSPVYIDRTQQTIQTEILIGKLEKAEAECRAHPSEISGNAAVLELLEELAEELRTEYTDDILSGYPWSNLWRAISKLREPKRESSEIQLINEKELLKKIQDSLFDIGYPGQKTVEEFAESALAAIRPYLHEPKRESGKQYILPEVMATAQAIYQAHCEEHNLVILDLFNCIDSFRRKWIEKANKFLKKKAVNHE